MATPLDEPVELLIDFCNTLDVEDGTDELATVESYRTWLAQRGLDELLPAPSPGDLAAAVSLRTTLRDCVAKACEIDDTADGDAHSQTDTARSLDVSVDVRIATDGTGVQLASDSAIGRVAAAAARLAIDGRLERMKICPADDCRWVFYDRSRNGSRQWCSMQVCGNRAKVRASRERARAAGGSTS